MSVDLDCFLCNANEKGLAEHAEDAERKENRNNEEVWEKGNRLIEEKGMVVERDFYKNSTFFLPGLMVENHQYLVPFRGNERLKELESFFQSQFKSLKGQEVQGGARIGDTYLYRPPVMVSALFLIEHAYSHFLHEGLTWRMVLDWVMFSKKHEKEINWTEFDKFIDEFGFRKFYGFMSHASRKENAC